MSESATPGNTQTVATLISGAEQSIARRIGATVAFVGRTLRGPTNQPVPINSFAEFQQEFGGLWKPSPLSYAIEQFFEQGGRRAIVVRVANGGAPPTISLPCDVGVLKLQALACGSREYLRAAVDYDNLTTAGKGDNEDTRDCFNLVVQRVRGPGSERIEVQETFRRVSINPRTQRFVANVLLESKLVRIAGEVPSMRPAITVSAGARYAVGYVHSSNDGDDGAPLTDYDVIGSATDHTGLFALQAVDDLAYLYVPPLAPDVPVGPSTLLVAEKFCRERRALLIVDPPAEWQSVAAALAGAAKLEFHSQHALMYFPRLLAMDRLRARTDSFANGGAVAGMLARNEELRPAWALGQSEPDQMLRSGARLACALSELDRWRLAMHGINTLRTSRSSSLIRLVPRTLAGGINSSADWGYLPLQRLASFIVTSIEQGTRWAMWARGEPSTWPRLRRQAGEFLSDLATLGAFPAADQQHAFMVVCDERTNSAADIDAGRTHLFVAFVGARAGQYHAFLITHSPIGSTIKPVSANPLEMPLVSEPQIQSVAENDGPLRLGDVASLARKVAGS